MTKITKMTKEQLIENIEKVESKLNNAQWVKQRKTFRLGVYVNHLAKLRAELKGRK